MAIRISFGFDGKNERAQKLAAKRGAKLVKEISAETRLALRMTIERAIRDGIPPYDAARLIESMVGLTSHQSQSVMNYRAGLVELGLPIAAVDRAVAALIKRKIKQRARTIARTELMSALNAGAHEGWAQAQKAGLLSATAQKRVVNSAGACPQVCAPMHGQVRLLSEPFTTPQGKQFNMPPFHPNCRDTVAVIP